MITTISAYIDYFESIRRRTLNYIHAIPPDKIDWSPKAGAFSCGDLVRHLAATEQMYITAVTESRWHYPEHERGQHNSLPDVIAHLETTHQQALAVLRILDDAELDQPRPALVPDSRPVKVWRWLMVMVEHEVHHRSELASYLTMLDVVPPQIFGIGVEDVILFAQDGRDRSK